MKRNFLLLSATFLSYLMAIFVTASGSGIASQVSVVNTPTQATVATSFAVGFRGDAMGPSKTAFLPDWRVRFAAAQQTSEPPLVRDSKLVLHDGEPVVMRALERATSSDAAVGQELRFEVIKPVKVGDLVVIPEGATATAKVVGVERPKRMGRGGRLSISIERVQMLDGQFAQLRAVVNRRAGGKGEMVSEMAGTVYLTYGLGLPLTPLFLLKHGNDMAVSPGDRFQAFVDGDVPLNLDTLVAASTSPAMRPDVAVVYLFRSAHDSFFGNPQESVLCGEALVGVFHPDQFVRLELPPGLYWFRTGKAVFKKTQRLHEKDYLALRVDAGSTYYLQVRAFRPSGWSDWDVHLIRLEPEAGAAAVTEINYKAEHPLDKPTTKDLEKLQLQLPFLSQLLINRVAVEKGTEAVISSDSGVCGERQFNNIRTNFVVEIP
jgi:hypothetical protein